MPRVFRTVSLSGVEPVEFGQFTGWLAKDADAGHRV